MRGGSCWIPDFRAAVTLFPLPFTCQHERYVKGIKDADGNEIPDWAIPVVVQCVWWPEDSQRQFGDESVSNEQASIDLNLVVDSSVVVDQRDRFTVDGRPFEVVGLPQDYDHGPFGFRPNRKLLKLRWVG